MAKKGLIENFEVSLQVLRGFDTDISLEVNDIKRTIASGSRKTTVHFAELAQRKYYVPLMIGTGLMTLQQLCGINGILFYSSSIIKAAGVSSSDVATLGIGAIQVVMSGIVIWLVDRTGRRVLLIVSSIGMTINLILVSVAFFVKDNVAESSRYYSAVIILSVVCLMAFVLFFCLGMGPIPWLIMSEIMPVNIRSLAGSTATMFNWFMAWLVTMTADMLLTWSPGGTFTIYTVISAFTVTFVIFFVPETKGRTLEDIECSFR